MQLLLKTSDAGMARAGSQTSAVAETDANQSCDTHRIWTRSSSAPASKIQGAKRIRRENCRLPVWRTGVAKFRPENLRSELKFFQVDILRRELCMQSSRSRCQSSLYSRPKNFESEFSEWRNSQKMGAPTRFQKKVQMMNLFKRYQNSNLVGLKMSWQTRESYPQRPLLKVELSASKRRHKRCSRRRFLLLKSLDSGNLLERLNRSMKALDRLRPWRQIPGKVLEGRRQNRQSVCSQKKIV